MSQVLFLLPISVFAHFFRLKFPNFENLDLCCSCMEVFNSDLERRLRAAWEPYYIAFPVYMCIPRQDHATMWAVSVQPLYRL